MAPIFPNRRRDARATSVRGKDHVTLGCIRKQLFKRLSMLLRSAGRQFCSMKSENDGNRRTFCSVSFFIFSFTLSLNELYRVM